MAEIGSERIRLAAAAVLSLGVLAGCGGGLPGADRQSQDEALRSEGLIRDPDRDTIFDLFLDNEDPNTTVEVNRYLWQASLEILDFMPIEAADPFSGVIQYGFGTPPGGSQAYRATVFVTDPALEARSLRVSVQTRNGAVSRETARQIEDAILTRARQIRIRDGGL